MVISFPDWGGCLGLLAGDRKLPPSGEFVGV